MLHRVLLPILFSFLFCFDVWIERGIYAVKGLGYHVKSWFRSENCHSVMIMLNSHDSCLIGIKKISRAQSFMDQHGTICMFVALREWKQKFEELRKKTHLVKEVGKVRVLDFQLQKLSSGEKFNDQS